MAAKTSCHRYGTKLRHCQSVIRIVTLGICAVQILSPTCLLTYLPHVQRDHSILIKHKARI